MLKINEYVLRRMGWFSCSSYMLSSYSLDIMFFDKSLVRYFIIDENSDKYYLISENQEDKNIYNFIIVNNSNKKIDILDLKSNIELFKLIYKYNACSSEYQRHFNINKILK